MRVTLLHNSLYLYRYMVHIFIYGYLLNEYIDIKASIYWLKNVLVLHNYKTRMLAFKYDFIVLININLFLK